MWAPSFQIDFGRRSEAHRFQPLRTGNTVVTFVYSSPAHNDVHAAEDFGGRGKAARAYSPIDLEGARRWRHGNLRNRAK
jgi:hypothetical protein